MNKKILIVIAVLVVIVGGALVWYFASSPAKVATNEPSGTSTTNKNNQTATATGKGTLYFTVTDAAVDMGNVSAVNITIDKLDIYSAKQGWVNVVSKPATFSLLELKAKSMALLLAKASLPADTYTQFKLHIAKVSVTELGKIKDANLPSATFQMGANVMLNGNTNSVVRFDIMADKSIIKSAAGVFTFAPAIKLDSSSNATVQVGTDNSVTVFGGLINPSVNAAMDLKGVVK